MTEEIIIEQNQSKQAGVMLLGFIMVGASIFVFFSTSELMGTLIFGKIIGLIGFLFFGAALLYIIKCFVNPSNILVINENGFIDNSSAISFGFIPWEEVKKIYISSVFSQKYISIELNNLDNIISSLSFFKRVMIKLNLLIGYAPISISLNSTDYKPVKILEVMLMFKNLYSNQPKQEEDQDTSK